MLVTLNAFIRNRTGLMPRQPGIIQGIADSQNSRREFPGISEILAGITVNLYQFCLFSIFIVDYDILVFNLTHDRLIPPFD